MTRDLKETYPSSAFYSGYIAALLWVLAEQPYQSIQKGNNRVKTKRDNGEIHNEGVQDSPESNEHS